jgi:hypothetical protein
MASTPPKSLPRWTKWLAYLGFFAAVGALVWTQLPRGAYPTASAESARDARRWYSPTTSTRWAA